jgi:hypothetical protein
MILVGTKEVNQFNGKSSTNSREESASRLGASVEYGGLYNLDNRNGKSPAFAAHYELNKGNGMLKPNLLLLP